MSVRRKLGAGKLGVAREGNTVHAQGGPLGRLPFTLAGSTTQQMAHQDLLCHAWSRQKRRAVLHEGEPSGHAQGGSLDYLLPTLQKATQNNDEATLDHSFRKSWGLAKLRSPLGDGAGHAQGGRLFGMVAAPL